MSNTLPNTGVTRNPRLPEVCNYLNNYCNMYTRLSRSRIRVELPFLACLRLEII